MKMYSSISILMKFNVLKKNINNIPGWRTNRKIVVIESDDWGSIRMPSKLVYKKLLKSGIAVDKSPYCRYDGLENDDDISLLFDILNSYKDKNENHPVITANTVIANPNFDKIKESNFKNYFFEPFTETYSSYPKHQNVFSIIKDGMKNKIWFPQFHGREHVNVSLWFNLLKNNNPTFVSAFNEKMWGLSTDVNKFHRSIQATYDYENKKDLSFHKESIITGLQLFQEIFGYRSTSFIANNFIWSDEINSTLKDYGVDIFQGMKYQKLPIGLKSKRKMKRHYLGDKNNLEQIYLIRNCKFEPSLENKPKESVQNCIKDIENAFFWKKPAIITSHRINFIGSIVEKNRTDNQVFFKELIERILKRWPDIEFMTSVQLGVLIKNDIM